MKDTLHEIQEQFGVSKAVFNGKLVNDNSGIEFECIESYDPHTANLNHEDIIVQMAVGAYNEHFDKNSLYRAGNITETVSRQIFNNVQKTFKNASALKNPFQSKLYKWLEFDKMMNSLYRREGIISLYRYIHKYTDDEFRFEGGSNNPHAKNFIAILEKMKEQYEQR